MTEFEKQALKLLAETNHHLAEAKHLLADTNHHLALIQRDIAALRKFQAPKGPPRDRANVNS